MTAKVQHRVVAAIVVAISALALLAMNAAAALAAPTMLVNGHLVVLGSNGAVRFQPQNTLSAGGQAGMLAAAVAIIAVVGGVAWSLDRRSSSSLVAVPAQPAGDEWQTIRDREGSEQDQERKAA
jgi:hypothetical protein